MVARQMDMLPTMAQKPPSINKLTFLEENLNFLQKHIHCGE